MPDTYSRRSRHTSATAATPTIPAATEVLGVSVREAVRLTGLGRTTICELVRSGAVASVLVGRRRIILRRSLAELLGSGGPA